MLLHVLVCILLIQYYYHTSVSLKGWYHGALPLFNFEVYAEIIVLLTVLTTLMSLIHFSTLNIYRGRGAKNHYTSTVLVNCIYM